MNLRQRLAGRVVASLPRQGPLTVSPGVQSGFEQRYWSVPSDVAVGGSDLWPVGFSSLVVPTAGAVAQGMTEVDSGAADPPSGPPAVAVDIETTGGLGRAAIPFILGAAWHDAVGTVVVMQWTLREPGAEMPMLLDFVTRLRGLVPPGQRGPRLLSFNGASFDLPVLRTRLQRLGLQGGLGEVTHVDLLTASRRLWRDRVPNCRLTTLESRKLGVRRVGDMEGAEVAEVFPQLLAAPADPWALAQLERARRHNRGDLLGLLALAALVGRQLRASEHPIEVLRAAQHYLRQGQEAQAWERLAALHRAPQALGRELVREYAWLRAELQRRRGDLSGAAEQWRWLCTNYPGDLEAHERLAKYLEHVAGDFEAALRVARASRCPCSRRISRLERKRGAV